MTVDLPPIEATLTMTCGHTTVSNDRRAPRVMDDINSGRKKDAYAFCPMILCRTDRRVTHVDIVQVDPKPPPVEVEDPEREIVEWETKHGYREGTPEKPGLMKPEFRGKHKKDGWGYDPRD